MKLNCVICFAKKAGEDTSAMIKNTEDNKKSAAEKEAEVRELLKQLNSKLEVIGNFVHDSVPVSNDEVYDLAISVHCANAYRELWIYECVIGKQCGRQIMGWETVGAKTKESCWACWAPRYCRFEERY